MIKKERHVLIVFPILTMKHLGFPEQFQRTEKWEFLLHMHV